MKILITTDWYKPAVNGVVTSVVSLSDEFTALGHDVRILTLSGDRHSRKCGNVTYIGSVGVGKIYPNARLRAAPSTRLIRELIDWHPDIIHSQCEFSTFFLAKRISEICGCPLIHTYHTVYEDFTHYFSPSIRFGKYMAAAFSKRILAKVQAVIVPTGKIREMLERYGVQAPVIIIPTGLELEQFSVPTDERERINLRRSLGLADDDQILIYLGRLAKEKNIEEVLMLIQREKNDKLRLLLVGDGPYRACLEKMVQDMALEQRVIFAGMVPTSEVARYYRIADVFISASQSETQGLTYIEAMASGLPILCREDPCLDDVVQSGINGFIYHDPDEFGKILKRLLSDTAYRRSVGQTAKDTVQRRYSSIEFAGKVIGVYVIFLKLFRPPVRWHDIRKRIRGLHNLHEAQEY